MNRYFDIFASCAKINKLHSRFSPTAHLCWGGALRQALFLSLWSSVVHTHTQHKTIFGAELLCVPIAANVGNCLLLAFDTISDISVFCSRYFGTTRYIFCFGRCFIPQKKRIAPPTFCGGLGVWRDPTEPLRAILARSP